MTTVFKRAAWWPVVALLLIGPALPALGQADPAAPAAVAAPAPAHGGGGFALLLLDYRLTLEGLSEQLRARGAELAGGMQLFPAEMMGAWDRVTGGTPPIALIAELLAILGVAFGARSDGAWRATLPRPRPCAPAVSLRVSGARCTALWSISWDSPPSSW